MPVLRRGDPGRSDQVPLLRQHARRGPPGPPAGSTELVDRRRGAAVHPLGLEVPPRVRTRLLRDLGPPGRSWSGLALPQDRRRVAIGLALVLRLGAPARRVSGAWWLLPIFMGWVGGLIAWLVNKDVDPKRARAMLITGIAISAVVVLLLVSAPPSTS